MINYSIARGGLAIIRINHRLYVRDIEQLICFAASMHGARNWKPGQAQRAAPNLSRIKD